eukprot:10582229-Karenia_brevis.AAC.1
MSLAFWCSRASLPDHIVVVEHEGSNERASVTFAGREQLANHLASTGQKLVGWCMWRATAARFPSVQDMEMHAEIMQDFPDIPFATCWSRGVEPMHGFQIWQVKQAARKHFSENVRRATLDADAGFLGATCLEHVPVSIASSAAARIVAIGRLLPRSTGQKEQKPILPLLTQCSLQQSRAMELMQFLRERSQESGKSILNVADWLDDAPMLGANLGQITKSIKTALADLQKQNLIT